MKTTTTSETPPAAGTFGEDLTSNVVLPGMVLPARVAVPQLPQGRTSAWHAFVRDARSGTSGCLVPVLALEPAPTGSSVVVHTAQAQKQPRSVPATVGEMLGTIRAAFSLTVTELAQVLRVQRPAIYSWLSDDAQPREQNLQRLITIWRLASRWLSTSDVPLGQARRLPGPSGLSPLELLSQEPLSESVAAELEFWDRSSLGTAASERGQGGRRAAAMLGRRGPVPGARDNVSFETGQRTSPE